MLSDHAETGKRPKEGFEKDCGRYPEALTTVEPVATRDMHPGPWPYFPGLTGVFAVYIVRFCLMFLQASCTDT